MADARAVYQAHPDAAEIADVLALRVSAAVGTLNADASIHLVYVLFLFEDGRLYFETSSVTRKARNVAARPTASILVQGRASSGRSLMVAAEGKARVIDGPEAHEINHRLRQKYIKSEALEAIDLAWGRLDDVAIEITPTNWRSWTGEVLHAATEHVLGGSYEDAWLPD